MGTPAYAEEFVTVCHFNGEPETKLVLSPQYERIGAEIDHIVIGGKKYVARDGGGSTGIPGRAWVANIGGKEITYFINGDESRIIRKGRKDIPGTCR